MSFVNADAAREQRKLEREERRPRRSSINLQPPGSLAAANDQVFRRSLRTFCTTPAVDDPSVLVRRSLRKERRGLDSSTSKKKSETVQERKLEGKTKLSSHSSSAISSKASVLDSGSNTFSTKGLTRYQKSLCESNNDTISLVSDADSDASPNGIDCHERDESDASDYRLKKPLQTSSEVERNASLAQDFRRKLGRRKPLSRKKRIERLQQDSHGALLKWLLRMRVATSRMSEASKQCGNPWTITVSSHPSSASSSKSSVPDSGSNISSTKGLTRQQQALEKHKDRMRKSTQATSSPNKPTTPTGKSRSTGKSKSRQKPLERTPPSEEPKTRKVTATSTKVDVFEVTTVTEVMNSAEGKTSIVVKEIASEEDQSKLGRVTNSDQRRSFSEKRPSSLHIEEVLCSHEETEERSKHQSCYSNDWYQKSLYESNNDTICLLSDADSDASSNGIDCHERDESDDSDNRLKKPLQTSSEVEQTASLAQDVLKMEKKATQPKKEERKTPARLPSSDPSKRVETIRAASEPKCNSSLHDSIQESIGSSEEKSNGHSHNGSGSLAEMVAEDEGGAPVDFEGTKAMWESKTNQW